MAAGSSSSGLSRPLADRWAPAPATTLDAFTRREWTDGVQVDRLAPFEALEVRTRNTVYRLVVLDGPAGEVLVSGGRFFPTPARVRLNGCTLGGSCLKLRGVYRGCRLEFQSGEDVILTTRVRSIDRAGLPDADRAVH